MGKGGFLEKVSDFARRHGMFEPGKRYLAAVSGGADSVVMLRAVIALGVDCEVAHCNFHLRGRESTRDQQFVERLCAELGVKAHITHFDVAAYERERGVSTEMACRELRYAWFRRLTAENGLAGVIVAHHSGDNIETLWLNILRGSGMAGMTAIRPRNGDILRPLLCVSRAEIEAWAAEIGQDFVTDSTNSQNTVKRNRLRNIILPTVRENFPDADTGTLRTIENMRQCNALYQLLVDEKRERFSDGSHIRLDEFVGEYSRAGCAEAMIFELIRPYGFNSAQAADIMAAYSGENPSGKRFLSPTHEAEISRGSLFVYPLKPSTGTDEWEIDLNQPLVSTPIAMRCETADSATFTPEGIDGKLTACFSAEILNARVTLRHWRKGDRVKPFGMRGTRLVSDIFSDLKLTARQKRDTWLLTADGQVAWIVGVRASALFPVIPAAGSYIKITALSQPDCGTLADIG